MSKVLNKYDNLLDYLSFYLLPIGIKIGMTPEQFWNQDTDLFWIYLEAYEQTQREKFEYDNNIAFLQGQYFLSAIAQCLQFSKHPKQIFPKKPFDLSNNENEEDKMFIQEQIRKSKMKKMCDLFKRR